ncbi:MAG: MBL fold metallo-hydrolase [Eubacteriales bacterium]|nr:MBL fold metallo-hydrolase [Eubacteriales bacterium]
MFVFSTVTAFADPVVIPNYTTQFAPGELTGPGSGLPNGSYQDGPGGSAYGPGMSNDATAATRLNGGTIIALKNEGSSSQQLSMVIVSSDGKVVVVDGGVEQDSAHLLKVIKQYGGRVDAWLITHPQTDHAGALYKILRDHKAEVDIAGIYFTFFEYEWYQAVDPDEIGMLFHLNEVFGSFDQSRLHKSLKRNDVITLSDKLSVRVMNDPIKTEGNAAVNGSGLMYDISVDGKHLIVLGDMSLEAGNIHMNNGVLDGIICDYVQMSHHGQAGVGEEFYKRLSPRNCIWPTPSWLYNVDRSNYKGYRTWETKEWISRLNVEGNFITMNGDVIIK